MSGFYSITGIIFKHGVWVMARRKAIRIDGVQAVAQSSKPIKKESKKLVPSKYLKEQYNIELPPMIAKFWDKAGYVDEEFNNELIRFDYRNPTELITGYWERMRAPSFFDYELEKFLSRYLFDEDPRYSIMVCFPDLSCEIDEETGSFEFWIYDRAKHEVIFFGGAIGRANMKEKDGKSYVEFEPFAIVVMPFKQND